MKHFALATLLAILPIYASAQDAQGRDTAGSWRVKHHEIFGMWDSICDENGPANTLIKRCYLRLVDVYSPAPEFGALFLFITPSEAGHRLEFGIELGTDFAPGGFAIVDSDGQPIWTLNRLLCLSGLSCTFHGKDAETLLALMQEGEAYAFELTDRFGNDQSLRWPLAPFREAFADYTRAAAERGLGVSD